MVKQITDPKRLIELTLKFLSIRPRSSKEISDYLYKKTSGEDLIKQTIDYLNQHKLINDFEFAQWLFASRTGTKPKGSKFIRLELKSKGVSQDIIDQVVTDDNQLELAQTALRKKLLPWSHLPYLEFKVKASRFLASRGFDWSIIESTIKKAYNETHVK